MKAFVLILRGGADLPSDALDGLTPLMSASMDATRSLARSGRVGSVRSAPRGAARSAGACALTLLGRDANEAMIGDAVLEAIGSGIAIDPRDWVFVLDLLSVHEPDDDEPGSIRNAWVDDLPDEEGRTLFEDLASAWRTDAPELMDGVEVVPIGAGRAIVIDRSGRDSSSVETIDPSELHGLGWDGALPKGAGASAGALRTLIGLGRDILEGHEINSARAEQGLCRADLAWFWGQGRREPIRSIRDTHGLHGAMICDSALGAGVAAVVGLESWVVERGAMTSDEHLMAIGAQSVSSIRANALTCVHVAAPVHASLRGDTHGKIRALESIDRLIVTDSIEAMRSAGEPWRVLVVPDMVHASATRRSVDAVVPFAIGGTDVVHVVERSLSESDASESDLRVEHGDELLEFALRSGLSGARDA